MGEVEVGDKGAGHHNSLLVTDYSTKMGIKTVPHYPYSDIWLFSKLKGCRYETIEEMKEAVTKVIDTLTQEDFHGGLPEVAETVFIIPYFLVVSYAFPRSKNCD